jgi:hypothetical protein
MLGTGGHTGGLERSTPFCTTDTGRSLETTTTMSSGWEWVKRRAEL